ncbi:MAG: efflux RND transporter periplasmic adaptor subunit [Anaerolineales bacterium]|nr:efflux RND transporter periplasmic adaptor subunit [Anaerolineales bacterium]
MQTKRNRKRQWLIGGLILIALIAVGLTALRIIDRPVQAAATGDIVTAFIGDLSANATADGTVRAQREAELSFINSGTVETVFVDVGDIVDAGDPLAQLETSDLERAVANAEQMLIIREADLETLLEPASDEDIAAAEAAVSSVQAQLDDLLDGPDEDDVAAAEAALRAAQSDLNAAYAGLSEETEGASVDEIEAAAIELELAQADATSAAEWHSTTLVMKPEGRLSQDRIDGMEEAARITAVEANARLAEAEYVYDIVINGDSNSIAALQANVSLRAAAVESAQAQLDLVLEGASDAEIAAAAATLAQKQAVLADLMDGATNLQIATAEAQAEQARISLQAAQQDLEDAMLTAPFAGTITAVHISSGEQTGGIAIEMVDPTSLEVVLDVDEVDVGEIVVGQTAVVTLETWPDVDIDATVASIAPENTATTADSTLVSYEVYLTLSETDLPILVGMTANAQLITDQKTDVLLIPSQAITPDRAAGKYYVNRIADGMTEQIEVTIGLSDDENTQITGGLEAGDQLLIGDAAPVQTISPPGGGPGGG